MSRRLAQGYHGDAPASAEYTQEQRDNAAIIVSAGRDLGLSARDQTIAVMTAMGESSLRNLDYGDWETSDVTNPDGTRTRIVSEVAEVVPNDRGEPMASKLFQWYWDHDTYVEPEKPSWNLEPGRPVVAEEDMVGAGCNPGFAEE